MQVPGSAAESTPIRKSKSHEKISESTNHDGEPKRPKRAPLVKIILPDDIPLGAREDTAAHVDIDTVDDSDIIPISLYPPQTHNETA